ncbi:sulfite exporter TauE/SafE family protein [Roseibacillus ishigakijimensis]|uniref:sulfite exporter TauE/SafE family protein n=1 Tax=Roseibacillus ishigakijimensis TaxID=454146 RepID=UPI0019037DF9|nr:sulfite exporter TauE/SafE family protein [Roseibacillus ishigakijimensis]
MPLLLALFFLIALLYSSVGFGGGSSYTAVLAWQGESPEVIRLVSLTCNLVVVLIGGWASLRAGQVRARLLGPLLASSIPGVWLGAHWEISERAFFLVLGLALAVAGGLLLGRFAEREEKARSPWLLLPLGLGLGFLAGLTGIGGGIYLVPVLHLLAVGRAREVAAVGTWFILVNSAVGLLALAPEADWSRPGWFPLVVAVGGLVGARLLQGVFAPHLIRRWTGCLILVVAGRLLFFQ